MAIILAQFNLIIHFRKQQKDAQNWTSFLLIFEEKNNQKLAENAQKRTTCRRFLVTRQSRGSNVDALEKAPCNRRHVPFQSEVQSEVGAHQSRF